MLDDSLNLFSAALGHLLLSELVAGPKNSTD